jgi:TonB family protein
MPGVVVALVLVCAFGLRPARADEANAAGPLFLKVADQTEIRSPGSPPFELDAKVNFFAGDGNPHPGSYKLVWLSPSEWREEISFTGYSRIRVGGEGRYWQLRSPEFELVQIHQLTDSLNFASRLRAAKSPGKLKSRKEFGEELHCSQTSNPWPREFCFNPTQAELVLEKIPNGPQSAIIEPISVRYSNFQAVGQRRFPGKIQITLGGDPLADFSLERLTSVEKTNPSDFVAPQGASLWLTCVAPEKQRMLSQVPPTYPREEKDNHRQGIVLMYGVIAPDGSVQSLKVLRAPSQAFADASVAAVRQWRYEPLVCGGVPTQLETFIHIIFSLGK